jgi:hypothetical protein
VLLLCNLASRQHVILPQAHDARPPVQFVLNTPALARPPVGRVWLAFLLFLAAVTLGTGWDRRWHATHPFEDFWSPPHLFIYAMVLLLATVVAHLVAAPQVRRWFGPAYRLAVLPFPLPGALLLLGGGVATITLAGGLDSVWHTAFGLDETGWSTPHAMLGWGVLITTLGLIGSRLAFRRHGRPLAWLTATVFAFLALSATTGILLGPLGRNHSVEVLRGIASLPVLAADPSAHHTFRIYEAWNLTRAHPLFVVVSAFGVGAGLALVHRLAPGWITFLLVALLATLLPVPTDLGVARAFGLAATPRAWLPLPILPAALLWLGLRALRVAPPFAWLSTGLVFGLLVAWIWGAPTGLALLAAPAMLLGAQLGEGFFRAVDTPTPRTVLPVLALGLVMPALTGAVDLYLRTHTP